MRIPIAVALCWCAAVSGCERERAKSPEELLAEDTTLAIDLARADDALDSGEPDTLIGLVDEDAPLTNPPPTPEPHIEHTTPDPGASQPGAAPRTSTPPAPVPSRRTVPASPPAEPRVIAASAPGCNSPTTADQRRCLLALLARYDVGLNAAYRDVIQRMRGDAGAGAGDPDPASVRDLRAAQRSWLVYRDRECRRRTRSREGQLWGPIRAQCLGQLSDARAAELRAM